MVPISPALIPPWPAPDAPVALLKLLVVVGLEVDPELLLVSAVLGVIVVGVELEVGLAPGALEEEYWDLKFV
jgi:hypothetical protein